MSDQQYMEGFDPFASAQEQVYLTAIREHGSHRAAAKVLDRDRSTIGSAMRRLRKRAAKRGFSPEHGMDNPSPEGTLRKRTSTLYKHDPETGLRTKALQWEINVPEQEARTEAWRAFAAELTDGLQPVLVIPLSDRDFSPGLTTVYPMGDPHIGMYAWAEEAGDDFDIEIATGQLQRAMARLVSSGPDSETGVIVNLGDFFHADNAENRTMRSGNVLDVDTRWQRVMRLGAHLMIDLVQMALRKHKRVVVRNAIGNHDDHSSLMLSLIMEAYFKDNVRVHVDTSPAMFWYYRPPNSKVLIGVTHGDKTKLSDLPLIMAADRSEEWGQTEHRYWYTGHIHNRTVEEHGGVICESFRTLAARDAYASGRGYRSGRDMHAVTLDAVFGEVERHRVDITVVG